jgi:hypothetical protein
VKGDERRFGGGINPGSDYTADEITFMLAVDRYKRANNCPHPSWEQVLMIARALGYRRVAAEEPLLLLPARQGR